MVLQVLIAAVAVVLILVLVDYVWWDSTLTLPEDGVMESLTAGVFLLGCVTAVGAFRRAANRQARTVAVLIGASALLAGLDEVSFGQRTAMFEYDPHVIRGVPIDAAHDVLVVGYEFLRSQVAGILLWLFVAAMVGAASAMLWITRRRLIDLDTHAVATRYFVAAVALVMAALIIDLSVATWEFVYVVEEMLELDAALVLTAGAAAQIADRHDAARSTQG